MKRPLTRMRFGKAACAAAAHASRVTAHSIFFMIGGLYSVLRAAASGMRRAIRDGTNPAATEAAKVTASEPAMRRAGVWNSMVQPNDCLLTTKMRIQERT